MSEGSLLATSDIYPELVQEAFPEAHFLLTEVGWLSLRAVAEAGNSDWVLGSSIAFTGEGLALPTPPLECETAPGS